MASYTRQSSFADGDTITAALFNNEFNQLVNAFHNSTGHKHDGTTAEGPVIGLIGDAGETSPNNKVLIDTTNNYIEFYVEVSSAPVQQLYIADGAIIPVTDSDVDLGTTSLRFKDTYTDTITTTGNVDVGGNLTVTGTTTFNGGTITMGDAATDNVVFGADVDSNIIPDDDDSYDLGSASQEWRNLYIDGTANIDSLVADTADINGGTIDGATIATSDITVGAGKTLDVSAGTLTLADDQISGDKVEGGTIAATTITTLGSTTGNITNVNATTVDTTNIEVTNLKAKDGTAAGSIADSTGVVTLASSVLTTTDINGGTIDGSTIATSDITVGASKTLDVSAGTLTLADNQISGDKVEGGTINATTINTLTFGSLNDGTITATAFVDEDDMTSDSATLIPTQQSVKAYVDSQVTAQDLDFQGDTGGALSIDLDSEALTIAGGTGLDTVGSGNTVTVAIDSTVATLTGSQTLTNKTIDVDNNTVSNIEVDNLKSGVLDTDLTSVAATDTTLASAKAIKTYVDAQITAEDLDLTTDSGTIAIDLDSETLSILGGTGLDSSATGNAVTIAIDSTVATLTGTQTLTNKTIDAASNTLSNIANSSLTNSTVSFGGVSLALGASDATPAFDLTDATNYPTSSLTGTITNAQLAGSIEVSKTLLAAGTGLTLTTNTLSVDAAQTQITSVGTLGSLTVSGDLTIDTSTLVVDSTNNRVGILDATPAVTLDVGTATDAIFVPSGTTAQRPGTPSNGYLRYNSDDAQFEGYADGAWGAIAGSGSGSAIEPQIFAGDGSTVDFTLTSAPTSENNLLVFIDGAFQAQDTYSVSGTTLTFSTAPANTRVVTVYHARSSISGSNMIVDTMTGDNSDVTLTLSVAPVSENNVQVYFDGVYQSKANYSISGTTLTFSTAPATGVAVEAITHTQTTINEPAANTVTPTKIAAGDFYFDTDTLYIDSTNNRVGIGTSSPDENLTISSSAPTIKLIDSDGTEQNTIIKQSGGNFFILARNNTDNAGIVFAGNGGDSFSEYARFNSSGNFGIGTASPNISGFSKALTIDSSESGIELSSSGTIQAMFAANTQGATIHGVGSSGIRMFTSASGSTTERMRIDSSGNVLVGKTANNNTTAGVVLRNIGEGSFVASGQRAGLFNRLSSDGEILNFRKDGTTVGNIGTTGGVIMIGSGNNNLGFFADRVQPLDSSGAGNDNAIDLGYPSARFDDIYATNGTIQTSDRNEKQDIESLSDAETRVAVAAKGLLRKFRWQSAVEEKGDEARIHFGIIAQDLQDAFTAEGLDAGDYAMFISTTWWETQTEVAAVEAVEATEDTEAVEAVEAYTRTDTYHTAEEAPEGATEITRLGVRYSELLAFIIAAI
jgi:hypothetical protein